MIVTHPDNLEWLKSQAETSMFHAHRLDATEIVADPHMEKWTKVYVLPDGRKLPKVKLAVATGDDEWFPTVITLRDKPGIPPTPEMIADLVRWGMLREEQEPLFLMMPQHSPVPSLESLPMTSQPTTWDYTLVNRALFNAIIGSLGIPKHLMNSHV
jgi:hypothetical protein